MTFLEHCHGFLSVTMLEERWTVLDVLILGSALLVVGAALLTRWILDW